MEQKPMFFRFRNSEHLQFFEDATGICNKRDLEALKIRKQVKQLVDATLALGNNFKQLRGSDITTSMTGLDHLRDVDIKLVRKVAGAYVNHFNEEKAQAGRLILRTIDKYGKNINRMNYKSETTVLTNIGKDFEKPECLEALKLMCLTDVVKHMLDANNNFNNLFLNRIEEKAENDSKGAAELIKEAVVNWNTLVDHIDAYRITNPSEELNILVKNLEELIDSYNTTVNNRNN